MFKYSTWNVLPKSSTWVNCTSFIHFVTRCLEFGYKEFYFYCKCILVPNISFQSVSNGDQNSHHLWFCHFQIVRSTISPNLGTSNIKHRHYTVYVHIKLTKDQLKHRISGKSLNPINKGIKISKKINLLVPWKEDHLKKFNKSRNLLVRW